jgi:hypothetical protein
MGREPDFSRMTEGEALHYLGARPAVKNGKLGLNLPIPGQPGETLFIEASDAKPDAIVATGDKRYRVRGDRQARCARCRRKVWMAPSSQEMLRKYPGTPVICLNCFLKQVEKEEGKV